MSLACDIAGEFGGGVDWVLDLTVPEIIELHIEARRRFHLKAQAMAAAVAQLFVKR